MSSDPNDNNIDENDPDDVAELPINDSVTDWIDLQCSSVLIVLRESTKKDDFNTELLLSYLSNRIEQIGLKSIRSSTMPNVLKVWCTGNEMELCVEADNIGLQLRRTDVDFLLWTDFDSSNPHLFEPYSKENKQLFTPVKRK